MGKNREDIGYTVEMNKAFIFDMDGVLINTEQAWLGREELLLTEMFGKEVYEKLDSPVGMSIQTIYEKAREKGATIDYDTYIRKYDEVSRAVYEEAKITEGLNDLVDTLRQFQYKLALVSSSPQSWIERVLSRLSFSHEFDEILSLFEHSELKPKPAPDGYIRALTDLDADPEQSFILEDSNIGIASAKASGAFVIGFSGNLPADYKQTGADKYADTMEKVIQIVEQTSKTR